MPPSIVLNVRNAFNRMMRNPIHASASRCRIAGCRMAPWARASPMTRCSSRSNPSCTPRVATPRSNPSSPIATRQPPFTSPTTSSRAARAPSKKTSLNSDVPVSWMIGRISTPAWRMGQRMNEIPLCFGADGSVRHTTKHQSAQWASDVHTFCPVITHSSPSRTARVCTLARSDPASGSE